jgi:hypothetical protein
MAGQEQPTTEALFHGMKAIAHGRLGYLAQERVCILKQQIMKRTSLQENSAEHIRSDSLSIGRNLHHHLVRHSISLQNRINARYSFVADDTDFDCVALFSDGYQREHAVGRKVAIVDAVTCAVEQFTFDQPDRL